MFYIETGKLFVEIGSLQKKKIINLEIIQCLVSRLLFDVAGLRLYLPGELKTCMPYKISFIIYRTKQKMSDTLFGNRDSAPFKFFFRRSVVGIFSNSLTQVQLTDSRLATHPTHDSNISQTLIEVLGTRLNMIEVLGKRLNMINN